jgi:hypothetical protein
MSVERGLRRVLLGAVALGTVTAALELLLAGHTESAVQWVPFGLAGLGFVAAGIAGVRPTRATLWGLRGSLGVLLLGGVFGIWEHLEHNYAFEAEIRPTAEVGELVLQAVQGGSPALAPGLFVFLALLGWAATWRHPSLQVGAQPE